MPILQVNFKLNVPADEYAASCQRGCSSDRRRLWTALEIWILNDQEKEAGGIYFFDTEQALSDYLSGPIVAQLANHPALTDVTAKRFQVMQELTSATRGPVSAMAAAQQ